MNKTDKLIARSVGASEVLLSLKAFMQHPTTVETSQSILYSEF